MPKSRKTASTVRPEIPPREPAEPKEWHCLVLIGVLVLLFFRDILLGHAFLWEDFLFYSYPVRSFAATSMAMGQMPLWNPYTFNGMPFLADIQTTVFYLPCTLLALFVKDGMLSYYWLECVVVCHYVLAGVGMFYLARSYGLRCLPSLFGGLAYMLSGFMIVHAIHQQIITMVAWYPLILVLFRKSLSDPRWVWVFVTAVVLGHSIFAGYPQLSLYFYLFLLAFFLVELFSTHKVGNLLSPPALGMTARAASIVLISVALAMVQLLPTLELADLSQRAQITYEKASEGSLAWSQLLTLVLPKIFGTAGAGGYEYYGPGTYWYYWETCIYIGALPLLLTLISLTIARGNRNLMFFWAVGIVVLLYSLGANFPLHRLVYEYVPGFSKFRNPARSSVFLSLVTTLLSAFSLQYLLYGEHDRTTLRRLRGMLIALGAAGILLWFLVISGSLAGMFPFLKNPHAFTMVKNDTLLSMVVWGISTASLLTMLGQTGRIRWGGWALIVILFADMLVFGSGQNNAQINPSDYFHRSANIVQYLKRNPEIFRVNTRHPQGMIMDRNQGMIDRIFMMEGYTPLALQRAYLPYVSGDVLFDLLNIKYKTVLDEKKHSLALVEHPTGLPRAFFVYAMHITHTDDELAGYIQSPAFHHREIAVLEKDPGFTLPALSHVPTAHVLITRYENNCIWLDVETENNGLLVLSEIYYPGWKATVDGNETEVFRTDYNLRSFFVPVGHHTIEVKFQPATYIEGGMITLSALLLCAVGSAISLIRSGRK